MRKLIFVLLIICLASAIHAQENWGPPESIVPDSWSDYCPITLTGFSYPSISSNDSLMFFSYDCVYTKGVVSSVFENGEWQIPVSIHNDLNDLWPGSLFFYDQGDTLLYFIASWEGGYGNADIWTIQLVNGVWSDPFNVGPIINTEGNERSPSLPDDDSRLYFVRNGTVMYSGKINGQYLDPIALPPQINGENAVRRPRISRDGQKLYFNRHGVYYYPDTILVSYFLNDEWQEPFPLSTYINCYHNDPNCAMMACTSFGPSFTGDGTKMYFTHLVAYGQFCIPGWDIMVSELVTDIDPSPLLTPAGFSLSAYPNPFNSQTNISLNGDLKTISDIAVYDITGRKIRSFKPSPQIIWDGTDDTGMSISSGIYFVKVSSGSSEKSLRITLLK